MVQIFISFVVSSIVKMFYFVIRCVAAKGDESGDCDKFAKYYRSLCPGEWVS